MRQLFVTFQPPVMPILEVESGDSGSTSKSKCNLLKLLKHSKYSVKGLLNEGLSVGNIKIMSNMFIFVVLSYPQDEKTFPSFCIDLFIVYNNTI